MVSIGHIKTFYGVQWECLKDQACDATAMGEGVGGWQHKVVKGQQVSLWYTLEHGGR